MKLLDNAFPVVSNVKSKKTAYTFSEDAQDAALAIDVITNKGYKYKIQTPVQEYICNARDAHRESGQTRPIEITLPTVFDPTFKVRDFGNGISPENMTTVFTKFFASTKRRDNNQTGGFGLGAKSAWAYTDSFGIVSITDGVKRNYTAYKSGQGMLQPEGEEKTTEHSGLEISIGVNPKDVEEFKKAVTHATFFWKKSERPSFTNNPTPFFANDPETFGRLSFFKSGDIELALGRYNSNSDYVLLDGVPYQLEEAEIRSLGITGFNDWTRNLKKFFLVLDTGEVSVTPFREGLEFNDFTRNSLKEKINSDNNLLTADYAKKLKLAKTVKEKVTVIQDFSNALNISEEKLTDCLTYNNGSIHINWTSEESVKELYFAKYDAEKMKNLCSVKATRYSRASIPVANLEIYEYDSKMDSCTETIAKRKFMQYAKSNPSKNCFFMSCGPQSQAMKNKVKEGFGVICTSTLTYTKAPTKTREIRKDTEATNLCLNETNDYLLDDKQLKNTSYIFASDYKSSKYEYDRIARFFKQKKMNLLSISKADEAHFIRKGAKPLNDAITALEFTDEELVYFFKNFEGSQYDYLIEMKEAFKNKAVLAHIEQMTTINKTTAKRDKMYEYSIYKFKPILEQNAEYKKMLTIAAESSKIITERYSLVESLVHIHINENNLKEIKAYIMTKDKGE
jgi:hypothetical protein